MAGYCTRRQHFHLSLAHENTSANLCNIQPYFTFTGAIIFVAGYHTTSQEPLGVTREYTCIRVIQVHVIINNSKEVSVARQLPCVLVL